MAITDTQQTAQFAAEAAVSAAEAKQYLLSIQQPVVDISESVADAQNSAAKAEMARDQAQDIADGLVQTIDSQLSEQEVQFESQMTTQQSSFDSSQSERESSFEEKSNEFELRFSSQLSTQGSTFSESQSDKEHRFQQFLLNSGYVFLGNYVDGPFQFSARNQYIRYNNQYYRLNAATDVGFTTTGTDATSFANDVTHFVLMDGDTLRQNLGSGDGTDLIGFGNDVITNSLCRTLKSFGAVGNGIDSDNDAALRADAWSISTGKPVLVTNGEYYLANVALGGEYHFDDNAWFVNSNLGATDNIIIAKPGLKLQNWKTKIGCVEWPTSGNYGNALLIGNYYQPADDSTIVNDVAISNFTIIGTTTAFSGQAVEILGNVDNVRMINGKCSGAGTAIIAHWGGDVNLNDPHDNNVTYSHHPRNMVFENISFDRQDGLEVRAVGLYLSACYNVRVRNISGVRCPSLVRVSPGDVYDQVSVSRDRGRVMTGIDIRDVYSRMPPDGNDNAIVISGIPDTYRTSAERLTALDPQSPYSITAENITVDMGGNAYSNPLILVRGAKNVIASFNAAAGDNTTLPWALVDYTTKSNIRFSGSCPGGVRSRGFSSSISEHAQHCNESVTYSGNVIGFNPQTFTQPGLMLQSGIEIGDRALVAKSATDFIIFCGAMLYSGSSYIGTVTRTTWLRANINEQIPVSKSASAIAAGSALTSHLASKGLSVRGSISGFMYNVKSTNTWGIDFSLNTERGFRGGILCDGTHCTSARFSGSYSGSGIEDGEAVNANIHISAGRVRNVIISGCRFDSDEVNNTIDSHVLITTDNHAGVVITGNAGTEPSALPFNVQNSSVNEPYSMQQIFGNHVPGVQAPITTVTGYYSGNYFRGVARNNATPNTGYWNIGDKIDRASVKIGGKEGWICSNVGSPGSWVEYGSIS